MTRVQERTASDDRPQIDGARRKAVLYCPVCGHESPAEGDWTVTRTETQREYTCPECDQVVAVR